jgi:hypothetical protein
MFCLLHTDRHKLGLKSFLFFISVVVFHVLSVYARGFYQWIFCVAIAFLFSMFAIYFSLRYYQVSYTIWQKLDAALLVGLSSWYFWFWGILFLVKLIAE